MNSLHPNTNMAQGLLLDEPKPRQWNKTHTAGQSEWAAEAVSPSGLSALAWDVKRLPHSHPLLDQIPQIQTSASTPSLSSATGCSKEPGGSSPTALVGATSLLWFSSPQSDFKMFYLLPIYFLQQRLCCLLPWYSLPFFLHHCPSSIWYTQTSAVIKF